jgi:hypothetical protein
MLALAACDSSPVATTADADVDEINWLFVLSATGGSFDGKTLTLRNVPPALMFSDRPYRVWGHMTLSELLPEVEQGPNNFLENPPNGVLSTFREGELPTEATVVMHQPTLDGADLLIPVDVLDGFIPSNFGPASMFVDHYHHHAAGAFIVGAAIGNAASQPDTIVVQQPTYVYHADPVPVPVAVSVAVPAPVAAPPAPASAQDRLANVQSMFEQNLISEQEYEKKRAEILDSM